MRKELEALEEKSKSPAFWDEAFGKGGEVYRRHRLAVELRRLDDLRERTDLADAARVEPASPRGARTRSPTSSSGSSCGSSGSSARAERELVHFDETDRGDAPAPIRAVGRQGRRERWAKELAANVRRVGGGAPLRRGDRDQHANARRARREGPLRVRVHEGRSTAGIACIATPKGNEHKRGDTYLARVEVRPLAGRAREAKGREGSRDDEPPIRTYDTLRSRGVRDRRTGHGDGDVRRVLGGRSRRSWKATPSSWSTAEAARQERLDAFQRRSVALKVRCAHVHRRGEHLHGLLREPPASARADRRAPPGARASGRRPHGSRARPEAREAIAGVLDFFDTFGVQHHEDEEKTLFPRLRRLPAFAEMLDAFDFQHRMAETEQSPSRPASRASRRTASAKCAAGPSLRGGATRPHARGGARPLSRSPRRASRVACSSR